MMRKPNTWEKKRDWLRKNFGTVSTDWYGPYKFTSVLKHAEISKGNTLSGIYGSGVTGEESIRELYDCVTGLKQDEHIVFGSGESVQHVRINSKTLELTPWTAPAAKAA